MTKLRSHEIVEYLEAKERGQSGDGRPVQFTDYAFSPDFTAEAVAAEFGASLSSALAKLNGMVKDGLLVSKRAEVIGRPGKRLVFMLAHQAPAPGDAANATAAGGRRDLLYLRNSKTVELSARGDAKVTSIYILRNVSNHEMTEIPLPKVRYDLYGNGSVYDHIDSMKLNGREIPYTSDALIHFKGVKPGKCGLGGGYYEKDDQRMHYVEIVYVVPLITPLKPGDSAEVEVVATYPRSYSDMQKFEYLSVKIREITMKAELRVVAPKGQSLVLLKRYEDVAYPHGVFVMDASTEIRKGELETEMEPPKVTKSTITWEIDRPVMGYLYGFPFAVRKGAPRSQTPSSRAF